MAPSTVQEYLESLPDKHRAALVTIREIILKHLPQGYEEGIQYDSIGYYVPHSICPDGYHSDPSQPIPFIGLASKKSGMTLNFFGLYVDPEAKQRFTSDWKSSGHKLNMGASCIHFKKLADVPLDILGETVAALSVDHFLDKYEAIIPEKARKKRSTGKCT